MDDLPQEITDIISHEEFCDLLYEWELDLWDWDIDEDLEDIEWWEA